MSTQALFRENALFAGDAIVARLRDQVPGLRRVVQHDDFDPVKGTKPQQMPAAVVLLDTLRVTANNPMRAQAILQQDWLVVLAARSARAAADANSATFGALVPQVVAALQGWSPSGCTRALAWRTAPRPLYGREVNYFPLLFSLQVVTA